MNIRDKKIQIITEYIKCQMNKGSHPSYAELQKKFNIGTYRIKLTNLYQKLGLNCLNLKCKRPNKSLILIKNDLIQYIKNEVKKNHYPTKRFIQNKFKLRLDIGIKDLYRQAGIDYKLKISQQLKTRKAELLQEIILEILPKLDLQLIKQQKVHEKGIDILTKNKTNELVGIELKAHHKYEPIKERNIKQLERFFDKENLKQIILITTSSKIDIKNLPFQY